MSIRYVGKVAVDGGVQPTMGEFTASLSGEHTLIADSDGFLQRSLAPFTASFRDGERWPINGWALTGGYMISDANQLETEPYATWNAEKDLCITQGFGPLPFIIEAFTRRYTYQKGINPNIKLLYYVDYTGVRADNTGDVGWPDYNRDLMTSGTRGGGESWWWHNTAGDRVTAPFAPTTDYEINQCVQFLPNNSFGRNMPQQILFEMQEEGAKVNPEGVFLDVWDGIYLDVVPPTYQQPIVFGQPGVNTNVDLNEDGVAESRSDEDIPVDPNDEDGYGGARMHRRALVQFIDFAQNIFGGDIIVWRNASRDGLDYTSGSLSTSTHPQTNSEYYQRWHGGIQEFSDLDIGLRRDLGAGSGYEIAYNGLTWFWVYQERIRANNVLAANHPWANGTNNKYISSACVLHDCRAWPTRTAADFNYIRAHGGFCALGSFMLAHRETTSRPLEPLDEFVYDWGDTVNPYGGSDGDRHSMGDFDPSIAVGAGFPGNDWLGTRAADYTSGSGEFHFAEFDNVLWVVRTDTTGAVGGAHGDGTPIACQLPDPGPSKVWKHMDFTTTYTNPNTGFSTRNQDPSLNDGSAVDPGGSFGTVSLLPWHAVMLQRADA